MPQNALFVGHSLVNQTMPQMLNRLLTGCSIRADAQVINGAPCNGNGNMAPMPSG